MCSSDLKLDGVEYPTVEHAYQAAKTVDPQERLQFQGDITAGQAKLAGRHVTLRPDWEEVKIDVMRDLSRQKYEDAIYAAFLLDTGDLYIEETNSWGDTFWGVCEGKGQNVLGNILMGIRTDLRK